MTKQEFIMDPLDHLPGINLEQVPAAWVSEAWQNDKFRIEATDALARSVSKTGSLKAAGVWLRLLSGSVLSRDQVIDLYQRVRDESRRLEMEWRKEFEEAFAEHKDALPEMDPKGIAYYFAFEFFWAIASGNVSRTNELIAKAQVQGVPLSKCSMPLRYFRQAAINLECMKQIPATKDDLVWTPLQLAKELSQREIEKLLETCW
jgi:hypothetical protein